MKENFFTRRTVLVLVIVATVLLGSSSAVHAQPMRLSPEERAKQLTQELSLTDSQAVEVLAIFKRADEEMRVIRDRNSGDRRAGMEAVRSIRDKSDTEIEKLLTVDQKKKFDEWKKNRPEPGPRRRDR